ncbi:helix-turn-helix domain-containing protein [Lentilactobacillus rapi DSM 19907 = JCM 15042]|uniref:Transcriptional regulator n=2 Tax=Lentilactobacillus rapi TaxID=481723 RepID=A0A512PNL2_9LACO|nr:helix-turn-helix transcriptional regulator [Lentilactobacillus rapi]KRL18537.1 helix-turn-helix domain-containing protein [Lentilactobacillus rapi DSM 19907 = JCM 15042]GEP72795.1 transcriptional regulator [Lentilactobacillus rapi]
MNIGNKIKTYRKVRGLSQEALAKKVYVSRQTISNWETNKGYPDIQNILLLSVLFDVSVDELVKGDLNAMKEKLANKKVNAQMSMYTWMMLISAVLGAISIGLVFFFEGSMAVVLIPIICFMIMFFSASKVERLKSNQNLKTYAEIVAFTEGRNVDEQRQKRNQVKDKWEKVMIVVGFTGVFLLIVLISIDCPYFHWRVRYF